MTTEKTLIIWKDGGRELDADVDVTYLTMDETETEIRHFVHEATYRACLTENYGKEFLVTETWTNVETGDMVRERKIAVVKLGRWRNY